MDSYSVSLQDLSDAEVAKLVEAFKDPSQCTWVWNPPQIYHYFIDGEGI